MKKFLVIFGVLSIVLSSLAWAQGEPPPETKDDTPGCCLEDGTHSPDPCP